MFSPQNQIAKVTKVNHRTETHGDKKKSAVDVFFSLTTSNRILDSFDPALRSALFRPAESGDQLRLVEEDVERPLLNMPRVGSIPWDEDFPGYNLECSTGAEIAEPVTAKVILSKFRFAPLDGGSVTVTFAATCHPAKGYMDAMSEFAEDSSVVISLTPPARDENDEADDEGSSHEPDPSQDTLDLQEQQAERERLAELGNGAATAKGE